MHALYKYKIYYAVQRVFRFALAHLDAIDPRRVQIAENFLLRNVTLHFVRQRYNPARRRVCDLLVRILWAVTIPPSVPAAWKS